MASSRGASRFCVTRDTRLIGAATDVPERFRMRLQLVEADAALAVGDLRLHQRLRQDPALAWTRMS